MMAKSNRLPCKAMKPAFSFSGAANGRIISRSALSRPARFAAIVWPVTVKRSACSKPACCNSHITAGTPPARWKRSPKYFPAGCMFSSSGTS